MCEQSENNYLDGDVVWVKLGSCWWPGEVIGPEKLPPDVLPSFRKPPIAVVKFFQEDTYEYVKNTNSIFKYNCSRKAEFINKGLYMYRTKHGLMEKFPEDVIRAETAVGGDIAILTRDEFQEEKKESYAGLFGDPSKRSSLSLKKGKSGRGRSSDISRVSTPTRKVKEKTNYKVHILLQGSKTPLSQSTDNNSTPSTSRAGSENPEEKSENVIEQTIDNISTPTMSSSGIYSCHACPFTTTRLNVLIMHNKTHSITFTPYTPSPVRKKSLKVKSTPNSSKTPKSRKTKQENPAKITKSNQAQKRPSQEKTIDTEVKKAKTDEEIKSSLLADWDDVGEDSNDESTMAMTGSPEVPVCADSPDVPTPAELPSAQIPSEMSTLCKGTEEQQTEKPETSSDSKYEFCEDEDWSLEEDAGRKIPRVKNPSKRKESLKSLSVEDDEVAREVNELLNKTAVPELPSVPDSLKVEENFPELSIAKSPDKRTDNLGDKSLSHKPQETKTNIDQPPKTIFKTKTFFRSRHSRSQDAIGKYVAEQLNAAERMDLSETETNGAEVASSPEPRDSPVEHVKVARLAPKIQLKKMKAEAERQQKDRIISDIKNNGTEITEKVTKSNKLTIEKDDTSDSSVTNIVHSKRILEDNIIVKEDISEVKSVLALPPCPTLLTSNSDNYGQTLIEGTIEVSVHKEDNVEKETNSISPQKVDAKNNDDSKKEVDEQLHYEQSVESRLTDTAVDALLNVSRETDRVTKIISNDPPEDLFDDDKDSGPVNILNGYNGNKCIDLKKMNELDVDSKQTEVSDGISMKKNNTVDNKLDQQKIEETKGETVITEDKPGLQGLVTGSAPTECDLQIAEALINLPSTAIQNKSFSEHQIAIPPLEIKPIEACEDILLGETIDPISRKETTIAQNMSEYNNEKKDGVVRYETEQEKSENLNAAQSLVQMSECIDHKLNFIEVNSENKNDTSCINIDEVKSGNDNAKLKLITKESSTEQSNGKSISYESSSKLLKILEKPTTPRLATNKTIIKKQVIVPGKEKILNFDVGKPIKGKSHPSKQKIIIRRTMPSKNLLNNVNEVSNLDKIILSHTNSSIQDGSPIQTYTIQTSPDTSDTNPIVIQQKFKKISKPLTKIQKIKPQTSLVTNVKETKLINETKRDESVFDINSMPIVLSDDIFTPENIEKMPIVMSDGNIITNSTNPPKLVKSKAAVVESEKPTLTPIISKPEIKTIVMSPSTESTKATTPNILSKSSKLRGAKPMLVIEKATGKKKIIMTPSETIKEVKQPTSTLLQTVSQTAGKTEKFIILPTPSSPRPARTQKIVIDPQTGKAHVLVGKAPETLSIPENKAVSAKLLQPSENINAGNTVMIITNSQGAQSKIILTPEHEKILFPNKANVSQLKTVTHKITTNSVIQQKTVVSTATTTKGQTRIVPKQKNAIITSKGQLIVGGLLASPTQNITPMPEIRPALKRIVPAEPKKIVQTIQKDAPEPLIFFQRKSGTVMQLTTAQFEHLQRTGQFISKSPSVVQENKVAIQKCVTTGAGEPTCKPTPKQRVRKATGDSQTPMKKAKPEIAIAPAPAPISPLPALTPLSNPISTNLIPVQTTASLPSASTYPDLDNFEELLPSTAIARQPEPVIIQPEQPNVSLQAPISDGQLLAVPGEHFGGLPGSFYLCVEDNGNYTIVDNRPLMLENNELVPMADPLPSVVAQPERRDILEAALANSDVFHADTARDEAPDFRDLNANVSVHCRVSETSTTLNQPIMTPVEVPTKADSEPAVPTNLEDGLAVIGVTPQTVPTSLELPITVTDPRIAPKTTDPLSNNNYGTAVLPSPSTQISFTSHVEQGDVTVGPISMPLLTDDESVGKSMPILTDDVTDRTVSSVESTIGSPSPVRESETEDSCQWSRRMQRMLTPGSDTSETSSEIPLQPALKLSATDLSHSD
ncbi:mucin-17-like [Battus philenor]|uniref:mucin-17-like n=1 Tax=Battus philenor TaxID=42288 RepID=UPI0035D0784A